MRLQDLGAEIRRARLSRGLTQAELAKKAGVSRTTLNQLENGHFPDLGVKKIQAILDCLELTLSVNEAIRRQDFVHMASSTASVSFRQPLSEDELIQVLLTGKVPENRRAHIRTLLDEANPALLQGLVKEAGQWTKAGRLEQNLRKIAENVGASRRIEEWLKTD